MEDHHEHTAGSVTLSAQRLIELKRSIATRSDVQPTFDKLAAGDTSSLVEAVIAATLALRASDIHIEPTADGAAVRFRIDGMLSDVATVTPRLYSLLLSRIKLLSELKLNIHDEPQEGRFSATMEEREIEIRASILPSQYGEDIALRVLDPRALLSFEDLGFRSDLQATIQQLLAMPQGLILVTGPTGSGKTTTLYAFVQALADESIKIVTIEDPIEYHLPNISQTQVNEERGYSFESGLEAVLRQDPDIVLLGELRNRDSAEAALQAALAGRKVLSTLHTTDAPGAVPRLAELGIDTSSIASGLAASIAQRLVRRLCAACKTKRTITKEEYEALTDMLATLPAGVERPALSVATSLAAPGEGCEKCGGAKYIGRIGIFEVLVIDDEMEQRILENVSEQFLRVEAIKLGMVTMQQDATLRILEGITTYREVVRILGPFPSRPAENEKAPQ
ncbi:MAG: GspE/PulE family protein [Candidatus Spechtbacterales bacterium]